MQFEHLPRDIDLQILLSLPFEDIMVFCKTNIRYSLICSDKYFWETKAALDFRVSPSEFNKTTLNGPNRYLQFLTSQLVADLYDKFGKGQYPLLDSLTLITDENLRSAFDFALQTNNNRLIKLLIDLALVTNSSNLIIQSLMIHADLTHDYQLVNYLLTSYRNLDQYYSIFKQILSSLIFDEKIINYLMNLASKELNQQQYDDLIVYLTHQAVINSLLPMIEYLLKIIPESIIYEIFKYGNWMLTDYIMLNDFLINPLYRQATLKGASDGNRQYLITQIA